VLDMRFLTLQTRRFLEGRVFAESLLDLILGLDQLGGQLALGLF